MKILFAGPLGEGQTSRMRMEVLRDLGHEIVPLNSLEMWAGCSPLMRHAQQKLNRGPVITRLNQAVRQAVREHKPDLFWGEKQEYLRPDTLEELRRAGVRMLHFTPDPYFTLSW